MHGHLIVKNLYYDLVFKVVCMYVCEAVVIVWETLKFTFHRND